MMSDCAEAIENARTRNRRAGAHEHHQRHQADPEAQQ
jgi:hypothetical protein